MPGPFKCKKEGCESSYASAGALHNHFKTKHCVTTEKCFFCGDLKRPQHSQHCKGIPEAHRTCFVCGVVCLNKMALYKHKKTAEHARNYNATVGEDEQKLAVPEYVCRVEGCGVVYKYGANLKYHYQSKHPEFAEALGSFPRSSTSKKKARHENGSKKGGGAKTVPQVGNQVPVHPLTASMSQVTRMNTPELTQAVQQSQQYTNTAMNYSQNSNNVAAYCNGRLIAQSRFGGLWNTQSAYHSAFCEGMSNPYLNSGCLTHNFGNILGNQGGRFTAIDNRDYGIGIKEKNHSNGPWETDDDDAQSSLDEKFDVISMLVALRDNIKGINTDKGTTQFSHLNGHGNRSGTGVLVTLHAEKNMSHNNNTTMTGARNIANGFVGCVERKPQQANFVEVRGIAHVSRTGVDQALQASSSTKAVQSEFQCGREVGVKVRYEMATGFDLRNGKVPIVPFGLPTKMIKNPV